jgi:hypothetical protein
MSYDTAKAARDFEEDTAYERLALATLANPDEAPPGAGFAINDIRGHSRTFSRSVHESLHADAAARVASRFRPLVFGAAYKVLDFLAEMAMRINGEPCIGGRWTFKQKTAFFCAAPAQLAPCPLDSAPAFWLRTARLYEALNEHRHAVVHRRTHIDPNGDLGGTDSSGAPLRPFKVVEQDALIRYAATLAGAVIETAASKRRLNVLAWNLDLLAPLHGCGILGASQPAAPLKVVDDLEPSASGRWKVHGGRLHAHLREQGVSAFGADAELYAVRGPSQSGSVYQAHMEDVPDDTVEVDLSALPAWLRLA